MLLKNPRFIEHISQRNKYAFVVPIHPKHFDYGKYIINELKDTDTDLYFVFTDVNDKNNFKSSLPNDVEVNSLLLTDFTDIDVVAKTNSFISIKKIYAVSVLYEKYDYISCIDSEIKFIKKDNFYEMMNNVVNSKTICGVKETGHTSITKDSLTRLIDEQSQKKLKEISEDYTIYTWWSNIPVVDCKNAKHFLEWINFKNSTLDRFVWNVFDDMLYNYFCVLFYDYKLKVIPNQHSSIVESVKTEDIEYIDKNINKLYWVYNKAYNQNKKYYDNSNFYIVFNVDR